MAATLSIQIHATIDTLPLNKFYCNQHDNVEKFMIMNKCICYKTFSTFPLSHHLIHSTVHLFHTYTAFPLCYVQSAYPQTVGHSGADSHVPKIQTKQCADLSIKRPDWLIQLLLSQSANTGKTSPTEPRQTDKYITVNLKLDRVCTYCSLKVELFNF